MGHLQTAYKLGFDLAWGEFIKEATDLPGLRAAGARIAKRIIRNPKVRAGEDTFKFVADASKPDSMHIEAAGDLIQPFRKEYQNVQYALGEKARGPLRPSVKKPYESPTVEKTIEYTPEQIEEGTKRTRAVKDRLKKQLDAWDQMSGPQKEMANRIGHLHEQSELNRAVASPNPFKRTALAETPVEAATRRTSHQDEHVLMHESNAIAGLGPEEEKVRSFFQTFRATSEPDAALLKMIQDVYPNFRYGETKLSPAMREKFREISNRQVRNQELEKFIENQLELSKTVYPMALSEEVLSTFPDHLQQKYLKGLRDWAMSQKEEIPEWVLKKFPEGIRKEYSAQFLKKRKPQAKRRKR